MDKIIYFSIKNKLIIGVLMLALVAWGGYSLTQLPIDAVPDITNNQVQVITISPSLSAQEIEKLVTYPVEISMANINGKAELRSFSRFGLSVVTIVFEDGVDVYWARQQVAELLQGVRSQIPTGVGEPFLAPITTGLGEIYQYIIKVDKGYENTYSLMDLRTIQDWIIRKQLLGTQGVAEVSSFGGFLKQYEVAIDPQKLKSFKLDINEVLLALEKNNQNTGGAYIDQTPKAFFIRVDGLVKSLDEIGKIKIKTTTNGLPILIEDVADLRFGSAIRYGAMTYGAESEAVGGVVMMLKGANSSTVITDVKDKMAEIQKTMPKGLVIEPFLDRTKLVNNAIHTVVKNLAEGALIVVFVLVLMLGNWRAGLVVASVIPLAMLFAISLMNLFGVSGNLMSLGAIDFGLIVDGAVIIVEATLHHLHQRVPINQKILQLNAQEMDEEVYQSAKQIRSSAAFGEIIILIVYLPILALSGVEGKMFGPMAQTVSFAILGAFILSLTYVPMASALFLSKKIKSEITFSDKLINKLYSFYKPAIEWVIYNRLKVVIPSVLLLIISIVLFLKMGGEFIPTLDEGDFAVETRVLQGSSINHTVDISKKAAKILLSKFPEVKEVVGKIGSSEVPTDPMPMEACDLIIVLKDKDEWVSADSREELANKMAEELSVLPGVTFGFQQPIQMRFNELMTGARQDVVLKVFGDDLDELVVQANKIGHLIGKENGVEDLYIEPITGQPQIQVSYNRAKLALYGLDIVDVNTVIQTAFAGKMTGLVFEGEKRFDLVVRLKENNRKQIEDVQNLFVNTAQNQQIPLSEVADISFVLGPNQIQRDETKRRIVIGFNVRDADVETVVNNIKVKLNKKLKLPTGYSISYGGSFKNLEEAKTRLSVAVPIALALIFILLYFTFQSIKMSALIFTAIPFSAIGGVFALYIRQMPFSISAGVGFIALFGVAVLNGIVLISHFNHLLKNENKSWYEIVIEGTYTRFRPVIMTALVASLGFLPMALSNSSGAEVQKPLATVVIGGLLSSTLLTLLVLPVLYLIINKVPSFKKNEK